MNSGMPVRLCSVKKSMVKILKIRTTKTTITITVLNTELIQCSNASNRCRWNCKEHRSRSSLIWVCTVCSDLSVPIFRIFTASQKKVTKNTEESDLLGPINTIAM